jgi:hypothetical protein
MDIGPIMQLLRQQVLQLQVDGNDDDNDDDMDMYVDGTASVLQPPLPLLPPFELYMMPPGTLLNSQKSLQDLGLVMAAKVYVSWKPSLRQPPPSTVPNNNNGNNYGPGWYLWLTLFLAASAGTPPELPILAALEKLDYSD